MSVDLSAAIADWNTVRTSLAQICASHDEFEHFFSGVFDHLEGLSSELAGRQKAWLDEQRETGQRLQRQAADLEQERSFLDEQRERIREEAERAQHERVTFDEHSGHDLQQMLEEAQRQRDALRDAREAAQSQTERLAELAGELIEARKELAEARAEIGRQRDALESAGRSGAPSQNDAELREEIHKLQTRGMEWDQERALLESELETVRNRAAEMAEALDEQKRHVAEERAQWAKELKRMRRLLERLSRRQAGVGAAPLSEAPQPDSAPRVVRDSSGGSSGGDPVLDSVVAQFEMLQRDLSRRRKQSAPSS